MYFKNLNISKRLKNHEKAEGKIAVIPGGNSGIGLATAQRFVDEDAYVFVNGRRQSELDAACQADRQKRHRCSGRRLKSGGS